MPELAEVEYFRRQWLPGLGQPVIAIDLHPQARVFRGCDVEALPRLLRKARLLSAQAHGKQLLFGFSGGHWLGVHLGMTGELRTCAQDVDAGRHDHLVLRLSKLSLIFADSRLFGRVRFDPSSPSPPAWWAGLPPALLSPGFSCDWIGSHLARRARSPIKSVLLDQSVFPGVGNWMADEILWRLGWHPLTPAGRLDTAGITALRQQVRWVTRRALATIGVDWREPPASWLYRHRWAAGTRCPRNDCRAELVREHAAGRTTCWCPQCQPDPRSLDTRPPPRPVGTGHRREHPLSATGALAPTDRHSLRNPR